MKKAIQAYMLQRKLRRTTKREEQIRNYLGTRYCPVQAKALRQLIQLVKEDTRLADSDWIAKYNEVLCVLNVRGRLLPIYKDTPWELANSLRESNRFLEDCWVKGQKIRASKYVN
jgi:hypothetical protein